MSDPLQVVPASDGSASISDLTTVNKTASGGIYPMEYTLHYRGMYVMNVTGPDGQVNPDCSHPSAFFLFTTQYKEIIPDCCVVKLLFSYYIARPACFVRLIPAVPSWPRARATRNVLVFRQSVFQEMPAAAPTTILFSKTPYLPSPPDLRPVCLVFVPHV